jgi:hypothetical protein
MNRLYEQEPNNIISEIKPSEAKYSKEVVNKVKLNEFKKSLTINKSELILL